MVLLQYGIGVLLVMIISGEAQPVRVLLDNDPVQLDIMSQPEAQIRRQPNGERPILLRTGCPHLEPVIRSLELNPMIVFVVRWWFLFLATVVIKTVCFTVRGPLVTSGLHLQNRRLVMKFILWVVLQIILWVGMLERMVLVSVVSRTRENIL